MTEALQSRALEALGMPAQASARTDLAELLSRVGDFVARYVVLPGAAEATAVALFVLHTWTMGAAQATPYVVVVSAEKGAGKTRLLEVLALIVRRPWSTASTTEAALFRKIAQDAPTLLLDEIDALFGSHTERTEPLRAVLNAGNRRGATATRVVGQGTSMQAREFTVFCAKVLAGIDTGRLPDTIRDRAIVLRMKRRHDGEPVQRLRYRHAERDAEPLTAALEAWGTAALDELREAEPDLPDELGDRAADAWEPLLVIADLAGGDWPVRARDAAVELSASGHDDEASVGVRLLGAIRNAMGRENIATAELLTAVNADDELPFGAWRDGKGLDARTLARLLKRYEIKPRTIRIGEDTPKGYRAADLADAWGRYLPPLSPPQVQHTQHENQPPDQPSRAVADVADVAAPADVAPTRGPSSHDTALVCAYRTHAEHWKPHPTTGHVICWRCHPPAGKLT